MIGWRRDREAWERPTTATFQPLLPYPRATVRGYGEGKRDGKEGGEKQKILKAMYRGDDQAERSHADDRGTGARPLRVLPPWTRPHAQGAPKSHISWTIPVFRGPQRALVAGPFSCSQGSKEP